MDKSSHPPFSPLLALFFAILTVSTASIFIKYALAAGAPALVVAACRLTIASLVLAPVALTCRRAELRSLTQRELALALLSGIFLAIHFAAWISSLTVTTVASSVVLVSTTPLWVALLAPFTIKEPVSRWVLAGMLLALVGGSIVGLSDSCAWSLGRLSCPDLGEFIRGKAFVADLLALLGALMAAGYLIIGRSLRLKISLISYIFVVYSMAAVVLIVILFAVGLSPFGYPPITYLWFLLLALVPQLLGHSTFNWALGYLSTAYVSIAMLGEPIGSTLLAYIFLQESPGLLKVFGAILILAGIYLASRSEPLQVPRDSCHKAE
jgi:drug/metabolite transporter (DMT)-like permease